MPPYLNLERTYIFQSTYSVLKLGQASNNKLINFLMPTNFKLLVFST